ncbi:MAG: hypothetical protein ACI9QL_004104 [Candidatus Omnitrophota bacterium]|jgi:hypothetical protein
MADDLIQNWLKPGMMEAEVVALLGTSPQTPWGSDASYIGDWDVEEYVDSSWVLIQYTPGRVLEAARITHLHY